LELFCRVGQLLGLSMQLTHMVGDGLGSTRYQSQFS